MRIEEDFSIHCPNRWKSCATSYLGEIWVGGEQEHADFGEQSSEAVNQNKKKMHAILILKQW